MLGNFCWMLDLLTLLPPRKWTRVRGGGWRSECALGMIRNIIMVMIMMVMMVFVTMVIMVMVVIVIMHQKRTEIRFIRS